MLSPIWFWLLPLPFGALWIAGIVWVWLQLPKDGWVPQSMGDRARQRLETG